MFWSGFPLPRVVCGAIAVAVLALGAVPAMGALPDGRGYELASPADKQGGDVMPITSRTRVAADGNAANFTSLVGFGDVHGATIGTEYLAQRTGLPGTSGWATHGITPKQNPFPLFGAFFASMDPAYDGEMSDDLSRGVFRAYRPLTDAPNVEGALNLYVRNDLRQPGEGFYQLISDPGAPVPAQPVPVRPYLAGASADFSHVIFESRLNLAAEASGDDVKLYEWADGTLRLAGILPDGTAAPSSQTGQGANSNDAGVPTPRMISADGSRLFFQAPAGSGSVYMRVNGTTTLQLNASEKSVRPRESPQSASLWTASRDGSRIFFSTDEGLVDGDDDNASDFYMYDVTAPAGRHLTLISPDGNTVDNDSVVGVVGASEDGQYLYFMMGGQVVAGEPQLDNQRGLYVWHNGSLRYIGFFTNPDNSTVNDLRASWGLNSSSVMARVSGDGSHVLFATQQDGGFRGRWGLRGFDHGSVACPVGCLELYVFDAVAGKLSCASCNAFGTQPVGDAQDNVKVDAAVSAVASTSHITRALSDDGRFAFFSSPDALVAGDVNGRVDAYEYDSVTDSVHLLSSGRSLDDSFFMDASASGRDAFFVTRERLVGWDVDGNLDLYDARVGGGLPDPVAPLPVCSGDACQGVAGGGPAAEVGASRGFDGKGNVRERLRHRGKKRCRHGLRRVHRRGRVRCVRKRAHRGRVVVMAGGFER